VESAAERAAQGQTEADAVAFLSRIGTSGREMTGAGGSGLNDPAMSVPARWSRRRSSFSLVLLSESDKQVAFANVLVGQHCALALLA
jgi:hypothetical protein